MYRLLLTRFYFSKPYPPDGRVSNVDKWLIPRFKYWWRFSKSVISKWKTNKDETSTGRFFLLPHWPLLVSCHRIGCTCLLEPTVLNKWCHIEGHSCWSPLSGRLWGRSGEDRTDYKSQPIWPLSHTQLGSPCVTITHYHMHGRHRERTPSFYFYSWNTHWNRSQLSLGDSMHGTHTIRINS